MAETKIVSLEAIQNIQQLKDNIKELKSEVNTLTVGSEEYNEKVLELAENQRALKLAMTGTYSSMQQVAQASRQDTDALNATVQATKEGTATYNQMSTALGALKQQIKDVPKYLSAQAQAIGEVNPAYTALNEKIQTLDSTLKQLDADNGVFGRNVGNYLGALQEWGGAMGQAAQVGNNLMSGMMSLIGVMSLLGVDTDGTKNALQAMVPVLALLNTAKGIGGLTKLLPKAAKGQTDLANATKKATVETKAQAGATNQLTTAEAGATTAGITLKAVLDSLGIGLIVTAVAALGTAIYGLITGTAKADAAAKEFEETQTKLNEAFEDEKAELENNNKLLEAQGTNANELIQRKIELIQKYVDEKQKIIEANNARLNEIEQHNWLQKLFKGEFGVKKELIKQNEELNKQVKEYNKEIASYKTEQQVNAIKAAQSATKKSLDDTTRNIENAVKIAENAIKAVRDERAGIDEDYKKDKENVEAALKQTEDLINNAKKYKLSKEVLNKLLEEQSTLQKGLNALEQVHNKNVNEYDDKKRAEAAKKYNELLEVRIKEQGIYLEETKKESLAYEKFLRNVLGFSEAQIRSNRKTSEETEKLAQQYINIGEIIEDDIRAFSELSGDVENFEFKTSFGGTIDFDTATFYAQTNPDQLAKLIGEPLASAIAAWVNNKKNFEDVKFKGFEERFTVFEEELSAKIESGNFKGAGNLVKAFKEHIEEEFENSPYLPAISKYIEDKMGDIVAAAENAEPIERLKSYNFIRDYYRGLLEAAEIGSKELQKKIEEAQNAFDIAIEFGIDIEPFKEQLESLYVEYANVIDKIDELRKKEQDTFKAEINDVLETYVNTTTDAIGSILNLWETAIKKRYYDQVKYGKMTEEEAEEQAKEEFEVVKAVQLGLAVVNTAAAIMSALATSGNWYAGVANAIVAAAEGAAQIMTISMQEFGKPSVTPSVSNSSTPTYTNEPEPIYYSVGLNPMDYAEAYAQTGPIKAYVVDSDLKEGLDNYDRRENEVTF